MMSSLTLRTTTPSPLLAKAGNVPCEAGGAHSPPYQGGVGGG